jgi:hypothetical protein
LRDDVPRHSAIEWAPEPAVDYLADRTAFDAFFEVELADGSLAFVGIETKLTDAFSDKRYDRPEYRRWMDRPGSPWVTTAGPRVADVRHNQLWRDHLLAIALRDQPRSRYVAGALLLVRHPLDTDGAAAVAGYQRLLVPGDRTFIDMPLDRLVRAWEPLVRGDKEEHWLAGFRTRYLDLAQSDAAAGAPRHA